MEETTDAIVLFGSFLLSSFFFFFFLFRLLQRVISSIGLSASFSVLLSLSLSLFFFDGGGSTLLLLIITHEALKAEHKTVHHVFVDLKMNEMVHAHQ